MSKKYYNITISIGDFEVDDTPQGDNQLNELAAFFKDKIIDTFSNDELYCQMSINEWKKKKDRKKITLNNYEKSRNKIFDRKISINQFNYNCNFSNNVILKMYEDNILNIDILKKKLNMNDKDFFEYLTSCMGEDRAKDCIENRSLYTIDSITPIEQVLKNMKNNNQSSVKSKSLQHDKFEEILNNYINSIFSKNDTNENEKKDSKNKIIKSKSSSLAGFFKDVGEQNNNKVSNTIKRFPITDLSQLKELFRYMDMSVPNHIHAICRYMNLTNVFLDQNPEFFDLNYLLKNDNFKRLLSIDTVFDQYINDIITFKKIHEIKEDVKEDKMLWKTIMSII